MPETSKIFNTPRGKLSVRYARALLHLVCGLAGPGHSGAVARAAFYTDMNTGTKKTNLLQIGLFVRELRLQKGYSSAEKFSNEYGINRSLYLRWESGKDMRVSSLLFLCDIHDITPCLFFEMLLKSENRIKS